MACRGGCIGGVFCVQLLVSDPFVVAAGMSSQTIDNTTHGIPSSHPQAEASPRARTPSSCRSALPRSTPWTRSRGCANRTRTRPSSRCTRRSWASPWGTRATSGCTRATGIGRRRPSEGKARQRGGGAHVQRPLKAIRKKKRKKREIGRAVGVVDCWFGHSCFFPISARESQRLYNSTQCVAWTRIPRTDLACLTNLECGSPGAVCRCSLAESGRPATASTEV